MNEASPEPDSTAPHALAKPLTLAATIAALGVVFGDIGTSPLYAFKECLRVKDAAGNFVGVSMVIPTLSLIIWSLILVVMFKYVLLVMEANEDGEGGIMTLVSLASSKDPAKGKRKHRSFLVLLGVFGAALLYGDGVITPAISVVSALEGVKEANERLHGPLGPEFLKYFIPTAAILILGRRAAGRNAGARIGGAIILIFAIQLQETVKGNHGTGGAELRAGILGGDIHRRLIHLGRGHL